MRKPIIRTRIGAIAAMLAAGCGGVEPLGTPCSDDYECGTAAGYFCVDGYCKRVECASHTDCPGQYCVDSRCRPSCTADRDCDEDDHCMTVTITGWCRTSHRACTGDGDCPPWDPCDRHLAGACVPGPAADPAGYRRLLTLHPAPGAPSDGTAPGAECARLYACICVRTPPVTNLCDSLERGWISESGCAALIDDYGCE